MYVEYPEPQFSVPSTTTQPGESEPKIIRSYSAKSINRLETRLQNYR